jgi:hypothetical protein
MYADKNYFMTQSRGPVGREGIPAEIRTGDTIRVKDRVLNVNHIFWTRYLDRAQWGRDAIDKAFIRGVLDGAVFGLYGHGSPDLADYPKCLSKPGSLEKVCQTMHNYQNLGQDLGELQAYAVAHGEVNACKELNE